MDTKSIVLNVVGAVLALALVALTFVNTIAMAAAVAVALGLFLLVYLGPDRLGTVMVVGGMFLTPQNDIRPLSAHSFSWCDVLFALGFALLLPRLLSNRSHVPTLFAVGGIGVFISSIASSLVAPNAGSSAYWAGFFIGAVVVLPLVFCLYGPDRKLMIWLAGAFVAGQVVSTLYALATGVGPSGRYEGTTFQPNYFAVGGLMAVALCPFLYQAAKPGLVRWIVLGAGGLSIAAIYLSGSRGVLLGLFAVALVYPLVERSVLSAYLLIALTIGIVPVLGLIAASVDEGSALGRLLGKDPTASGSNDIRRDSLTDGWHRFLGHPILGSGFEDNLSYHNIFLQVPVAIGVLTGRQRAQRPLAVAGEEPEVAGRRGRHLGGELAGPVEQPHVGVAADRLAVAVTWPWMMASLATLMPSSDRPPWFAPHIRKGFLRPRPARRRARSGRRRASRTRSRSRRSS
jgi:hypothetical protein